MSNCWIFSLELCPNGLRSKIQPKGWEFTQNYLQSLFRTTFKQNLDCLQSFLAFIGMVIIPTNLRHPVKGLSVSVP